MIISASRRCDILRFQFDWFIKRIEAGFADVTNPYNAAQARRISLEPGEAEFFVFWTRDPRPLLNAPAVLAKYPFYVMITLTGYPQILEPDVPSTDEIIAAMKTLAGQWGNKRVIWRYDPVLLTSLTDTGFHAENFSRLAESIGTAVRRVIVSIYDDYAGAARRFAKLKKNGVCDLLPHYSDDGHLLPEVRDLLGKFALFAKKAGMEMQTCAEKDDLSDLGIVKGACIDGSLINEITCDPGDPAAANKHAPAASKSGPAAKKSAGAAARDKNQRPFCHCAPSVDIGTYGSCPAGCVYCYARR